MAFDLVVRHDTDGSITLLDGTGTPVTIGSGRPSSGESGMRPSTVLSVSR